MTMTVVSWSKNSVLVSGGGSKYEYHGINPYHQRLLKFLLKKNKIGQAWQLLRQYKAIKMTASNKPFITICCYCRSAIKQDGVWATCSKDEVIAAEKKLCSHGHCPTCYKIVSQHIKEIQDEI